MANYANLEAAIVAAVYENANNEITGAALQSVLLQMVSSMGKSGMLCNGVADGSTTPPVNPDSNIFYIAPTGTYPNFGGLVVADGEWAIFIYNGSWQKQSVPVVTADAVPTTGSTNPVQSGGVADALEQKADIDGYYSTLTAGAAENLVGRGSVLAEYTRRTSGGSADIGSGAAAIEKIHGNTIVWNQYEPNATFADGTTGYSSYGSSTISASDGKLSVNVASAYAGFITPSFALISGHKYLLRMVVNCPASTGLLIYHSGNSFIPGTTLAAGLNVFTGTATAPNSATGGLILRFAVVQTYTVTSVLFFDLTQMGLESIDTDKFNSLFPLNYYAYNTGSLLSLTGTGIETNGFNQWDEEWESGYWDVSDGSAHTGVNWVRSKNAIKCFPSTAYCLYTPANLGNRGALLYYDGEGGYLSYVSIPSSIYSSSGFVFTTPTGCEQVKFYMASDYNGAPFCLNLSWSGYRNGEYEAYWDSTLALPITTVTSGGSAVFADGMKSANTVSDELTGTKAVKRVEKVDLGTLSWNLASNRFYAQISGCSSRSSGVSNMITAAYPTRNNASPSISGVQANGEYCQSLNYVVIYDTNYATTAAFTTAMSGKYLYYELDTPVEYTLDSEVNLNYRVDDFGTETLLPQNNATPTTAPIVYDVRYAMNAVDTLRNLPTNYISKDSLKNLLDAFVSAGVISAYTMTYNAGTEQYTFTITA